MTALLLLWIILVPLILFVTHSFSLIWHFMHIFHALMYYLGNYILYLWNTGATISYFWIAFSAWTNVSHSNFQHCACLLGVILDATKTSGLDSQQTWRLGQKFPHQTQSHYVIFLSWSFLVSFSFWCYCGFCSDPEFTEMLSLTLVNFISMLLILCPGSLKLEVS